MVYLCISVMGNKMERRKFLVLGIAIAAAASDYTLGIFGSANDDVPYVVRFRGERNGKKEAKARKMGEERGGR